MNNESTKEGRDGREQSFGFGTQENAFCLERKDKNEVRERWETFERHLRTCLNVAKEDSSENRHIQN